MEEDIEVELSDEELKALLDDLPNILRELETEYPQSNSSNPGKAKRKR